MDVHPEQSQASCEHDYEVRVLKSPAFHTEKYVIKKSHHSCLYQSRWLKKQSKRPYNKLQSNTTGLFHVVSVQMNTVTIEEQGIPYIVSADSVIHVSSILDRT